MNEFICPIRVRHNECDAQGIVFNANFLVYVDVALAEMWAQLFGSYEKAVEKYQLDTVVGSITIDFKAPAYPGDDLQVVLKMDSIGTTSINYAFRIQRDQDDVAIGTIRYVGIDPETKAKKPVPENLRKVLLTP